MNLGAKPANDHGPLAATIVAGRSPRVGRSAGT
jgi:hypothetical protein